MAPAHAQLSVSIAPTAATIDVGEYESFSSTVSGGSGNYSFQWYLSGTTVSGATSSSWTFKPNSTGSYIICLIVKDLSTKSIQSSQPNATVTVNTALSISISPTSVTLDVGQSQTFTATASGGTSPYEYYWSLNKGSYSGPFTSPSWTFTPSLKGSYNVTCEVTDSSHADIPPVWPTSIANVVTVNPPPTVTVSPTSVTLDVGQSQVFASYVQGGTSPYTYQWCLNNAAVSGATSSSWTFMPSSSGAYSIYVNVTDNVGFKVKSNTASATVNAAPLVSISPYNFTWEINHTYTFTESVTGGTSPYTYYWGYGQSISQAYINMGSNGPTTSNTWTFNFTSLGNWIVICNVFDSAKGTPILGPWGSTAYVNIVTYPLLHLSANVTVPNLAFTINGTSHPGPVVYQPFPPGTYTISVSPTTYIYHVGGKYFIEYEFVGWSNSTSPGTIIYTSSTITITLNKDTGLIADYIIYTNLQ